MGQPTPTLSLLDYVGIAFSGAKLMLLDDKDKAALTFTDIFVEVLIEDDKVIFVEKHKGNIGHRLQSH